MEKKRIIRNSFVLLALMVCAWVLMYIFVPDEDHGFYQSNKDIDLNSGALRERRCFWIIPVKHVVLQTPFSRMVSEYVKITDKPVWKEDYKGVSISLSDRGGGGRLWYICDDIAYMIEMSERHGLSEEDKKDYVIKALGLLRENNIDALEDLDDELSRQLGFFVPSRDVFRRKTPDDRNE